MFALTKLRFTAILTFGLATAVGCAPSENTGSARQRENQEGVRLWLAQQDVQVDRLDKDDADAYNFIVDIGEGRMVVNIKAYDDVPLTAPLTFHPAVADGFIGRDRDLKPGEIDATEAPFWITSSETPTLCGLRKVDTKAKVTLADGSVHEVGVGVSWADSKLSNYDFSNGGCPNPAGAKGKAACDKHPECAIELPLGFKKHGTCYYSDLWITTACLCEVLLPDPNPMPQPPTTTPDPIDVAIPQQ